MCNNNKITVDRPPPDGSRTLTLFELINFFNRFKSPILQAWNISFIIIIDAAVVAAVAVVPRWCTSNDGQDDCAGECINNVDDDDDVDGCDDGDANFVLDVLFCCCAWLWLGW